MESPWEVGEGGEIGWRLEARSLGVECLGELEGKVTEGLGILQPHPHHPWGFRFS